MLAVAAPISEVLFIFIQSFLLSFDRQGHYCWSAGSLALYSCAEKLFLPLEESGSVGVVIMDAFYDDSYLWSRQDGVLPDFPHPLCALVCNCAGVLDRWLVVW